MPYPSPTYYPGTGDYPGTASNPAAPTSVANYPASTLFLSDNLYPGVATIVSVIPESTGLTPPGSGPLILQDRNGTEVAGLEVDHTLRFEVSQAASVSFFIGYDEIGASELLEMLTSMTPRLHAYRNRELIFSGWWMPQTESLDGTGSDGITCEFRGSFARVETRYLAGTATYADQDAGLIAWDLIDTTNADQPTGLTQGEFDSVVHLDRTYAPGQQISDAIVGDLITVKDSFQFTETPVAVSTGHVNAFNIWADLGKNLTDTVQFEYGPTTIGNVLDVQRTISAPINRAIAIGGTATTPEIANDTTSQNLYGLYENAIDFSSTVNNQNQLKQLAARMLQPDPIQEVGFTPDIDAGIQPFDDYGLGDMVSFRAVQDALVIEAAPQITAIEIDRDGSGLETAHRLEFGPVVVEPLVAERVRGRLRFRHKRRTGGRKGHLHQHGKARLVRHLQQGKGHLTGQGHASGKPGSLKRRK